MPDYPLNSDGQCWLCCDRKTMGSGKLGDPIEWCWICQKDKRGSYKQMNIYIVEFFNGIDRPSHPIVSFHNEGDAKDMVKRANASLKEKQLDSGSYWNDYKEIQPSPFKFDGKDYFVEEGGASFGYYSLEIK